MHAQAWAHPSFQPPRVTSREYNFGFADAGFSGVTLLFQWREGIGNDTQLSLDAGIADPDGRDNLHALLGGQFAYQMMRSRADVPLDLLFTAGIFLAAGDPSVVRVPVGLSIGHRIPLEGGVALTPYVHPRLSLDFCGECRNDSDVSVAVDLGLNLELTRTIALRVSALFSGSDYFDDNGFGISLAITPMGITRSTRRVR
jgi:hypothetical protein